MSVHILQPFAINGDGDKCVCGVRLSGKPGRRAGTSAADPNLDCERCFFRVLRTWQRIDPDINPVPASWCSRVPSGWPWDDPRWVSEYLSDNYEFLLRYKAKYPVSIDLPILDEPNPERFHRRYPSFPHCAWVPITETTARWFFLTEADRALFLALAPDVPAEDRVHQKQRRDETFLVSREAP